MTHFRRFLLAAAFLFSTGCGEEPAPRPRVSNIDWNSVYSVYHMTSNATDLRREEEWKHLKGKRVRWSGLVMEVSDGFGGLTMDVKMGSGSIASDVCVHLNASAKSKALQLQQDQRIMFEGTLSEWSRVPAVTLVDGEILSDASAAEDTNQLLPDLPEILFASDAELRRAKPSQLSNGRD